MFAAESELDEVRVALGVLSPAPPVPRWLTEFVAEHTEWPATPVDPQGIVITIHVFDFWNIYCSRTQMSNEQPKGQNRLIPCNIRHSPPLPSQTKEEERGGRVSPLAWYQLVLTFRSVVWLFGRWQYKPKDTERYDRKKVRLWPYLMTRWCVRCQLLLIVTGNPDRRHR